MRNKTAMILTLLTVMIVGYAMPASAQNRGRQEKNWSSHNEDRRSNKESRKWAKKHPSYGYKNYGQYRRTQVGNRRFRLARRVVMFNGVRTPRWVRVYY
jgi:Ni/Co efflux regulator RcnB